MALSRCKKRIIREISVEIEKGSVEEQNLERLEVLEKILREEGSVLPESMKEAYSRVAVECTARCLVCADEAGKTYTEAVRRIWTQRVMNLCERESRLVTSDLMGQCQILLAALRDHKACQVLIEENTRNRALLSLKRLVSEPLLTGNTGRPSPQIVEDMAGGGEEEVAPRSGPSEDTEILAEDKLQRNAGESDAEPSFPRIKTIPSAVFNRVLGNLRASKHDLLDALGKEDASVPSDETNTEGRDASANPSAQNNASKPSMMERNSTAQTYEWEDSIDDSNGGPGSHARRVRLPRLKKVVVSPLRGKETSKGARRKQVPWTTAETLAVLKGYESHGANWIQIKAENPIVLARRTNVDIKDRFRAVKRHEEARRRAAREVE